MTEAKERRTDLDRAMDTVKSLRGEIASWIGRYAGPGAWTFERILKWRKERVFDHPRYKKLPRWAHTELTTTFDIYLNALDHTLVWTHVFDGKRLLSGDPSINDRAKDVHDQQVALEAAGKANSAFCYAYALPDRRLLLVPYREDDRTKEMESGRLTDADLALIHDHKTVWLNRGNMLSGPQVLTTIVAVTVENGIVKLPESNIRLF